MWWKTTTSCRSRSCSCVYLPPTCLPCPPSSSQSYITSISYPRFLLTLGCVHSWCWVQSVRIVGVFFLRSLTASWTWRGGWCGSIIQVFGRKPPPLPLSRSRPQPVEHASLRRHCSKEFSLFSEVCCWCVLELLYVQAFGGNHRRYCCIAVDSDPLPLSYLSCWLNYFNALLLFREVSCWYVSIMIQVLYTKLSLVILA